MNTHDHGIPLDDESLLRYITSDNPDEAARLFAAARETCRKYYGNRVYMRGLIEFTNFCQNDCFYCGIRVGNKNVSRYRLDEDQVLDCCRRGYELGFRTFVLQGGEDPYYAGDRLTSLVARIREGFPECAITLSVGERSRESYEALYRAGANRYLLRHETANNEHYSQLHPPGMLLEQRKQCLRDLKEIGFQVGAGFMVGSPHQTPATLLEDLRFLRELQPHMVGIGPFMPQSDTPFGGMERGSPELTLRMVALCRLLLPDALIPATTALATALPDGRERGLMAGANVVMPNLSPTETRDSYALYDGKLSVGAESGAGLAALAARLRAYGFEPCLGRGDHISIG